MKTIGPKVGWTFLPGIEGLALKALMAAPGAPRCEDCAGDLEHPYDFKCRRCALADVSSRDGGGGGYFGDHDMTDFEADDKRADWLKLLDKEAAKLAEDGKISPGELDELRTEGWVSGKRETGLDMGRTTGRIDPCRT